MTAKQLKIESNLPIIFLTILVIASIIIGFLELKKVNLKINTIGKVLETKINDMNKKLDNTPPPQTKSNKLKNEIPLSKDDNEDNKISLTTNYKEDKVNEDKIDIINKINQMNNEVCEEENDEGKYNEISHPFIQSGILLPNQFNFLNKEFHEGSVDIEEINDIKYKGNLEENDDTKIDNIEKDVYSSKVGSGQVDDVNDDVNDEVEEVEEVEEEYGDGSNDSDDSEESEDGSDDSDGGGGDDDDDDDDDETSIVDLKELVVDEGDGVFEKEKTVVNDNYSVSQLKQLCKNMGLSVSGNKSSLIMRINNTQ